MAEKKLYDNLYKVIKANSGAYTGNDGIMTEILDLQIPRGYSARIRRVIFEDHINSDQADQVHLRTIGCLALDPDDENSTQIPTFTIDHDILCDFAHEYIRLEEDTTPNGIAMSHTQETVHSFDEELDVVTVRNIRYNSSVHGFKVDGESKPQTRVTVYFTYEKVSMDLYAKLLGIS